MIVKNKEGKFSYAGDNWYCQKDDFKSDAEYVGGSFKKAVDYINNYAEKAEGQYYYVLV